MISPIDRNHRADRPTRRVADDSGASLVEYSLLVTLIAVFLVTAVAFFGDSVLGLYRSIIDALPF